MNIVKPADLSNLTQNDLMSSVFIYPSDTCYGLGCNATDKRLVDRVKKIKRRNKDKPLSIMVDSLDMFRVYGKTDDMIEQLIRKYLPGEITFVVPKTDHVPDFLNPGNTTVGIRFPKHDFCLALIHMLQFPIITTSANVAGNKNLYSLEDIVSEFQEEEEKPDIVFDGNKLDIVPPSTVVEVIEGKIRILRQGRVEITK